MSLTVDIIKAAQAAFKKYNIPASITLAQFGLESAWGTKMPQGSFNPFGIKAVAGQPSVIVSTREVNKAGKSYYIKAPFRKFANFEEAFDAHGKLLGESHYYAAARAAYAKTKDVKDFVAKMAPVYATDPKYYTMIMTIIRDRNLSQYDGV